MPIRFRCAYCNQLMGISTRKAGTVVKCPKCAGEIIVPSPDVPQATDEPAEQAVEPAADQPAPAPAGPAAAFEEKNFEDYFNEAANGSVGASAPARTETAPSEPAPDLAAIPPPPAPLPPPHLRRGLFLTLGALVFSIVIILVLLILVFMLGLFIGRTTAPRESAGVNTSAKRR
jgi:hypothetical protein